MSRIFHLPLSAACLAALCIAGCASGAAPGAGSRAMATHHAKTVHFNGIVPSHVMTWVSIKQSDNVSPTQAAPYVDWAAVNVPDANAWSAAGIKTVLYTNPNRTGPGGEMYTQDETTFAHDCNGARITVLGKPGPTYQMDPRSPNLSQVWAAWVTRVLQGKVHYDAIFDDSADSVRNLSAVPCGFDQTAWTAASRVMDGAVGQPVVFNGLGTLSDGNTNPPPAIGLNPTAFGGELEGCYNNLTAYNPVPKRAVWQNYENTELTMSIQHKMFVCRGFAAPPAQTSYDLRLYMYASFLLSYDPGSSVISEKFSTPSNVQVEPESQLVALNPLIATPADISTLGSAPYTYGRQYADCYLGGQPIGACAAVVNADGSKQTHPFPWPGVYAHTLVLNGAGTLDGGTASPNGPPPGPTINGASAEIAIQ
jgi:hypothetical protein